MTVSLQCSGSTTGQADGQKRPELEKVVEIFICQYKITQIN